MTHSTVADPKPRIDVVIPVRDGLPHIRDAVRSALGQRDVESNVIVVDDGSSDGTPDAVRSWGGPRVTVIDGLGRNGTGRARNIGVSHSRAPWLTFLDADDIWPLDRSRQLIDAIEDPEWELAVGHMLPFCGASPDPAADRSVTGAPPALVAGGFMLSRALYDKVGPQHEDMRVAEFVDWMARARSAGVREVHVPVVSLLRRSHDDNTSRVRKDDFATEYLRLIARHRHRARVRAGQS